MALSLKMESLSKSFIIPGLLFLFLRNEKCGLDILEILCMIASLLSSFRGRERKRIGLKNKCVSHGLRLIGAGLASQTSTLGWPRMPSPFLLYLLHSSPLLQCSSLCFSVYMREITINSGSEFSSLFRKAATLKLKFLVPSSKWSENHLLALFG